MSASCTNGPIFSILWNHTSKVRNGANGTIRYTNGSGYPKAELQLIGDKMSLQSIFNHLILMGFMVGKILKAQLIDLEFAFQHTWS